MTWVPFFFSAKAQVHLSLQINAESFYLIMKYFSHEGRGLFQDDSTHTRALSSLMRMKIISIIYCIMSFNRQISTSTEELADFQSTSSYTYFIIIFFSFSRWIFRACACRPNPDDPLDNFFLHALNKILVMPTEEKFYRSKKEKRKKRFFPFCLQPYIKIMGAINQCLLSLAIKGPRVLS